jgi:hypothetical protein
MWLGLLHSTVDEFLGQMSQEEQLEAVLLYMTYLGSHSVTCCSQRPTQRKGRKTRPHFSMRGMSISHYRKSMWMGGLTGTTEENIICSTVWVVENSKTGKAGSLKLVCGKSSNHQTWKITSDKSHSQ